MQIHRPGLSGIQYTVGTHFDNEREVDRYVAEPGQATAYYVGMREILQLRDAARRELGTRFDLRRFHDAVLGNGPLPLPILKQEVVAWLAAQGRAAVAE